MLLTSLPQPPPPKKKTNLGTALALLTSKRKVDFELRHFFHIFKPIFSFPHVKSCKIVHSNSPIIMIFLMLILVAYGSISGFYYQ